jgi:hypothetical protein
MARLAERLSRLLEATELSDRMQVAVLRDAAARSRRMPTGSAVC